MVNICKQKYHYHVDWQYHADWLSFRQRERVELIHINMISSVTYSVINKGYVLLWMIK